MYREKKKKSTIGANKPVVYMEVCPLYGGVSFIWRCVLYMEVCPLYGVSNNRGYSVMDLSIYIL